MSWEQIRGELVRRKNIGEPVLTPINEVINWIDEIGDNYVIMRSELTQKPRKITARQIETCSTSNRRIKVALRRLQDPQFK